MIRRAALALAACVCCLSVRHADAGGQWTIVDSFAVPEGASGLAWDGMWLYCGIYGANGDEVYRIDPGTGASTLLFTGPQEDAFGMTYDGQYLWVTDHGTGSDPAIAVQLDWDGTVLDQFDLPAHYMSGIAYDNGDFWVARYYRDPSHIFLVDNAGVVQDDFAAPDNQPWDLCLEGGNLWMADYFGDALYRIDANTGALLESHPSEGVDPAGIVWDGQYLWYCDNGQGFQQDFLYKVSLQGGGTPAIDIPVASHDFGTVTIGSPDTWFMTVDNNGTAALEISGVSFSPPGDLSCTASFPVSIPMGGTDQLPIVYDPAADTPLSATATVSSNDPVNPAEDVTLSGHGVFPGPTLVITDTSHDYGVVRVGAHTRWFAEVANHGDQVLTISDITSDDGNFYVDHLLTLPINLSPLDSAPIGLWFNPGSTAPDSALIDLVSNDPRLGPAAISLSGSGIQTDYPMGTTLWTYVIDAGFDNSPKAMASIPDVSDDGVNDVIVCSEDDYVRCFNGNAHGTGDVLWEHEIYAGPVYSQFGIQIVDDIDSDGYPDVVVASAWGGRLIRAISGRNGDEIWTHDTHEYGDGGWVYQVDCSHDYNGDGTVDVLAATGDDASDTGPKRVYCLNGLTGASFWERPLGGPGFAVIGVEDFTGDSRPDVVAGASNESETQGRAVGINGFNGSEEWSFLVAGSSVWALAQIVDITSDGTPDVLVGDFGTGQIYGLDATDGSQVYTNGGFGTLTRFERLDDVNGDGGDDFAPTHFSTFARAIDGATGGAVWTTPLVDKPAAVARIADVSGDGVNDLVAGTLFTSNYTYFLDGVDGSVLQSASYGTPVDAITATPDIVGDGSWEMVAGGRNGLVRCLSGGLAVIPCPMDCGDGDGTVGVVDLLALLAQWGGSGSCDADGGGVGVTDLLLLLATWGACP